MPVEKNRHQIFMFFPDLINASPKSPAQYALQLYLKPIFKKMPKKTKPGSLNYFRGYRESTLQNYE